MRRTDVFLVVGCCCCCCWLLVVVVVVVLPAAFLGGSHKTDIHLRATWANSMWFTRKAGQLQMHWRRFAGVQKPRDASMFLYTTYHDIIYQNIQFSKYTIYQITHFKIYNLSNFIQVGRQAFMYIGNIFPLKKLEYCDPFKRSMLKTDMMIIGSWVFFSCVGKSLETKRFFLEFFIHAYHISSKICQIRS